MDLTPAQKRELTKKAKKTEKELKKLELELAGAKRGRPTKEFTSQLKKRRESAVKIQNIMRSYLAKKKPAKITAATKLQNAYRARLAREEKRRLQAEMDYITKADLERLNKAKGVIGGFLLRKAVQNRGLPKVEESKFDTGKTGMEDFLQIMKENSDKIYSLDQKLEQIAQAKTVQNAPIGLTMEQEMVADAQKTIGNRLIAYNYNKELRQELNLRREFETKSGTVKSVRDVLLKASLDKIAKNRAREKLSGKKIAQELLNSQPSTNVVGAIINTDLPEANIYEGYEERDISIPAVKAKVGLYGNRITAGQQQMMEEESQQQANARETIGNRLMAYNFRRDYIRELGNFKPINTQSGEVKIAKDILEKALNDYKLKKLARYKLGGIITLQQKLGLEGRLFSADNNRTEMPGGSAYSDIIQDRAQRTIGSSIKRRLAMNKYEWDKGMVGVGMRIGRRRAGSVIAASMKRALAQRSIGAGSMVGLRPRLGHSRAANVIAASLKRGLAQRSMAIAGHINRMATTLPTLELVADTTSSPTVARAAAVVANDIVGRSGNYKPPMGAKGTQERANYMAWLRAERIGGKRVLKAGTTYKGLSVFGPMNRPKRSAKLPVFGPANRRGRPSKYTAPAVVATAALPTVVPASAAPSTTVRRTRVSKKLPVFGPPNRRGRPSKYTPPAVSAVAAVAPKKRGRPSKVMSMSGMSGTMSIPRAVMTGNGAAARKGRPRKLTTDTARLVKDVVKLRKSGKSTKSIAYAILTGSKGTAGKRGRPGKIVTDTGRVVKDVLKLQGARRR